MTAPKLVTSLVASKPIGGVVQILLGITLAISDRPPFEPWLGIILACMAVITTYRALRSVTTRVTETDVSQVTWRGRTSLLFAEVTGMAKKPYALTLSGRRGRVIVPVESFENTEEAIAYIESRLPPHLNAK